MAAASENVVSQRLGRSLPRKRSEGISDLSRHDIADILTVQRHMFWAGGLDEAFVLGSGSARYAGNALGESADLDSCVAVLRDSNGGHRTIGGAGVTDPAGVEERRMPVDEDPTEPTLAPEPAIKMSA